MSGKPQSPCCVAVVGGGFSGAAVAIHLLKQAPAGFDLVLVEPACEPGRGLAYDTPNASHCLNVPAGRLGLERESGFIDWLIAEGMLYCPGDFVPRRWMGAYVASELADAVRAASARGVRVRMLRDRVEGVTRNRSPYPLRLQSGRSLLAAQVVLATGHMPPACPIVAGSIGWDDPRMVCDPWRFRSEGLGSQDPILLVGTGLTAIDLVSTLRDRGHTGAIHLLSRRGLLPQAHRVNEARPPAGFSPVADLGDELGLRAILRAIRGWVATTQARGGDWRDVMASLRPWTPQLWHRLSVRDRRQFLRHLQPFWDTHRHRLAPEIHDRVHSLLEAGSASLHVGRLLRVDALGDGRLEVTWRARGEVGQQRLAVARVVNCTGPTSSLCRARDTLHASLRESGMLSADALGLGIVVDSAFRPVDASGVSAEGIHYVGPMLRAQRWEAVAVPELRTIAAEIARRVLATHRQRIELDAAQPAA
jgi:uncharacterized NAD(P)/FAD-binding protein YdhS